MELTPAVGETAGKVWQSLSSGGPQTPSGLKKKINGSCPLVELAVGWLAREEKVTITQVKKSLEVCLKEPTSPMRSQSGRDSRSKCAVPRECGFSPQGLSFGHGDSRPMPSVLRGQQSVTMLNRGQKGP